MDQNSIRNALSTQASYTLDDAIAYQLGLLQRGLVKSEINVTLDGIAEEDLREISKLPGSLNEHLIALANAAKLDNNPDEVARIDRLLVAADIYNQYLTDEIAKGSGSEIRIDSIVSQETGVPHFTLRSIKEWHTRNKEAIDREINAYHRQNSNEAPTNTSHAVDSDEAPTNASHAVDKNPTATKVRNLNNTIGLLLHLVTDLPGCPGNLKKGDEPNYQNLASKIASINDRKFGSNVPSQSLESVRRVLRDAYKNLSEYRSK